MITIRRFLPLLAVVLLPCCGSTSGTLKRGVYEAPDGSFELRLPEGVRRGTLSDEFRSQGSLVSFAEGGGRRWRFARFEKGSHHITRSSPGLPPATRLMFAESSWAEARGLAARPVLGRELLTVGVLEPMLVAVRPGEQGARGLLGALFFETTGFMQVIELVDEDAGADEVASIQRELVGLRRAVTIHDG
jgi:hypothetical protein